MTGSGDGTILHPGGNGLRPLADARGGERPDNRNMERCAASSIEQPVPAAGDALSQHDRSAALEQALLHETAERRRIECMAHIQDQAAQLALDLIVTEPEIAGFFAELTRQLVEETEGHACGVWVLDEDGSRCELWLAHLHQSLYTPRQDGWDELAIPRVPMAEHLFAYAPGWTQTTVYTSHDSRLPEAVQRFNARERVEAMSAVPLLLGSKPLGWIVLSTGDASACERSWQVAMVEAFARQATLVLRQSQLADQRRLEDRRKAILEERNRLARDIHDTLAQGFGAILMQLQAAEREAGDLPPRVAASLAVAVNLARTHLVDARRSVGALRPLGNNGRDITMGLKRLAETARLTTDVPIEVIAGELPILDIGVEREIIGIAQEALTNAARHARARRITIQASATRDIGFRLSVADDGRGIAHDRRNSGFGMISMQERADRIGASLTIVTAPRAGTEVVLAWEPSGVGV
jgi:signal transduction histidine kinase